MTGILNVGLVELLKGVGDAGDVHLQSDACRSLLEVGRPAGSGEARPSQRVDSLAKADVVGLSQQATSHHLGVLREAGLATTTREGARHLYAVRTDGLAAVRSYLDGFWPARLAALKAAVEEREETQEAPGARESRERR